MVLAKRKWGTIVKLSDQIVGLSPPDLVALNR